MTKNETLYNPRVVVIQKLYSHHLNKDSEIIFPKHRYKKFIKDVVNGTIERTNKERLKISTIIADPNISLVDIYVRTLREPGDILTKRFEKLGTVNRNNRDGNKSILTSSPL